MRNKLCASWQRNKENLNINRKIKHKGTNFKNFLKSQKLFNALNRIYTKKKNNLRNLWKQKIRVFMHILPYYKHLADEIQNFTVLSKVSRKQTQAPWPRVQRANWCYVLWGTPLTTRTRRKSQKISQLLVITAVMTLCQIRQLIVSKSLIHTYFPVQT